jgi:hypothetical protein
MTKMIFVAVYLSALAVLTLDVFVWRQDPPIHEKEQSSSACGHSVREFKPT